MADFARDGRWLAIVGIGEDGAAGLGLRVEHAQELRGALRRGIEVTRAGQPFLVEVVVQKVGGGADSEWFQKFNLAETRKRRV